MKTIWILLVGIILSCNTFATQFIEGKQYIMLNKQIDTKSTVLKLFSFYCPPCFLLERAFYFSNKKLPEEIKTTKYHVELLGPLGKELTQAWAVAIALGIEEKILFPMFDAVQINRSIKTSADIRKVFINMGVEEKHYDSLWNSFVVKSLVEQQKNVVKGLQLCSLPAIYINGKYKLNIQAMNTKSIDIFTQQYIDIVKYLVKK